MIPSLSSLIRRLHDTGRSGWWLWINLIPLFGPISLLIFTVEDSQPSENGYGLTVNWLFGAPRATFRYAINWAAFIKYHFMVRRLYTRSAGVATMTCSLPVYSTPEKFASRHLGLAGFPHDENPVGLNGSAQHLLAVDLPVFSWR